MRKITTLFKRDFANNGQIMDEYSGGIEWVLNGEGKATRKYDGTCCLVREGKLYKRYELKEGRTPPPDFEAVDEDKTTHKIMGWVQVGWGSEDKWHREAITGGNPDKVDLPDGTYELLGPKVQGNPEHYKEFKLLKHSEAEVLENVPTGFNELKDYLADKDIEGIVWHHPDGRMAKIKLKDYRLNRPNPLSSEEEV